MSAMPIDFAAYRKRKNKSRVFEALEQFQQDVLIPLETEKSDSKVIPDEIEEFIVQVLGDQMVSKLGSANETRTLKANYKRFASRLKKCLQTKLNTLRRFEGFEKF